MAKLADLWAIRVDLFMQKLVEVAIAKALRPYVKAEEKQRELIEAHKLRMDRFELIIDDHGKELANLKDIVAKVKKVGGGSANISALKANLDLLKKEVTALRSTDLHTFFDGLKYPPLNVDMAVITNEELTVNILGNGGEKN